jgi:hypothetical protein
MSLRLLTGSLHLTSLESTIYVRFEHGVASNFLLFNLPSVPVNGHPATYFLP